MTSEVQLGQFITTQKGYAFKSKWYSDDGHPIVKVSDFTSDSIDIKNLVLIPQEIANDYRKYELNTDDVIVQTVGSWPSNPASVVGKAIRVPKNASGALLNQNAVKIDAGETLDKGFLYYLLRDDAFKEYIVGTAQGAASQASITLNSIRAYKFICPSLKQQENISSTLSAYDNLIENNNRRIAILEDMAQSLYQEWFIKFRFPRHQNTEFKESPLGFIPAGWEVKFFTKIAGVLGGGTPKTKEPAYWDGEIPFFAPKDAPDNFYVTTTEKHVTELGIEKSSTKLYPKDTVFITARGTVGKVVLPSRDMTMNQSCYALKAKNDISQKFLFLMIKTQVAYLKKNTGGATFDTIVTDTFKAMKVVVPLKDTIQDFDRIVEPIFDQILNLINKNLNLKLQRDLLLPKLISGSISV